MLILWMALEQTHHYLHISIHFYQYIFAMIFNARPQSVGGINGESFIDTFFFSVETMSTIGYGHKFPNTNFGNFVVTVEAIIGLLFGAVVTGITFTKFSSMGDSVMFTDKAIVTEYEGEKTLMFRLGNARGNDIVDAKVEVVALLNENTDEKHALKRMVNLKLVRNSSPLFKLTWTVMHTIDEDSPIFGIEKSNKEDLIGIVVTMTGYDATYGSTTYARITYSQEDIRRNFKFADIISYLDDGRLFVDYERFHKLEQI